MNAMGHNESAVRLAALAGDAQIALDKVAKGEADATEGWLAYGAALNEGRALFPGDREFGQWVAESCSSNLEMHPAEQPAAMWAAANADQLAEAKTSSKARTLRGWHEQWKKIEQERDAARQKAEREAEKKRKDAEAAAARAEADEKAKAEQAAQKAVAAASTDEDREIAEAKAEAAAEEKAEADRAAEAAEAAAHQDDEPEADLETVKVMHELAKMTPEGVAGLVMEARVALADEKAKAKAIKAERDALKAQLADLTSDDKDTVIRRLTASLKNAENAKWRATEEQGCIQKQVYALKKRVAELEGMAIPI